MDWTINSMNITKPGIQEKRFMDSWFPDKNQCAIFCWPVQKNLKLGQLKTNMSIKSAIVRTDFQWLHQSIQNF